MFSKKQLVIVGLIFAILFHFVFYFNNYGPTLAIFQGYFIYAFAFASVLIMIFLYLGTYWRVDLKRSNIKWLYDALVLWIFICFVRSIVDMRASKELVPFLFSNYMGLSLCPVLFFIVGINSNYFFSVNRLLSIYLVLATVISIPFIDFFELQIFLLMPLFYVILTMPLKSFWSKILILSVSIGIIIISLTNRAGILRILISYCIILAYFTMSNVRISKKLINFLVFLILLLPAVSIYLGLSGVSVFQILSGEETGTYSQFNPYADTRTFLYYEVFQDLKVNKAFIFGKGLNAGYYSASFETFSRPNVEVGFLQIILKTGILGFLLYMSIIVMAIFKALSDSNNLFIKSLGLLLASYVIMFFIENIIAYNLLNVIIWIVVGMCFSENLRKMNNKEIKELFHNIKPTDLNPEKVDS